MPLSNKARVLLRPARDLLAKRHLLRRQKYLTGAYPDIESALAAVPRNALAGYDHDEVVVIKQDVMSSVLEWDYPVLFWLSQLLHENGGKMRLIDSGGHVGTKFIAFSSLIDLAGVDWMVHDLPALVRAGRRFAEAEGLADSLSFTTDPAEGGARDLLLCSGLLQYLDTPFTDLVGKLETPPTYILLNKVAVREGPPVVTLQKAGPTYLPYQIRNLAAFEAEVADLGYTVLDSWQISSLSHRIDSHPELGRSTSMGYMLVSHSACKGNLPYRTNFSQQNAKVSQLVG